MNMKRVLSWLTFGFVIASLSVASVAGEYSSDFDLYLADHQSDTMIEAIITMADQVDLDALKADLYAVHADRQLWHETIVRALQEKATYTQAGILAELSDLASQGMVAKVRGLWVGNVILVTATREALEIIVNRDDVLSVNPNYPIENNEPVAKGGDTPSIAGVESGLRAIRADEVWAMGITGEGRLVSHLDTGVDGNHGALSARWRGLDSRYANNPEWAWFDPVTNTQFPFDGGSHGTHTMGTICGLGGADTIGVAFGAQWMSAGVIDRVSIPRTVQDALASFEWIADPDGDPSTAWDVPDVCSNSWGVTTGHGYPPCDETFWVVLDGCEAAGVVVVFAAGNEGPGASTLRRPADRATTDISSFSVGALDGNDSNLPIAGFSSRGPSNCTPDGQPTIKPEVSAPGVNVRSSVPGGGYQSGWSGTSMACPHVAGVVALMRQANPNLTSEQVREIILSTATDLGADGEDNAYGMGIINAYDAVIMAMSLLDGWGVMAGVVTDQASGTPIQGAVVSVVGRDFSATTRSNGSYTLYIPADTLWNIRVDNPPTHLPIFDQQTVAENETLIVNYALEGKVTVTLTASFANPEDASYRSFYYKGSWDNDGFYDADWSGDLIQVSDNGVAPDNVAGDGIYTGAVMLARDTQNTYSWAIYSENYGGENANLDGGASFQIPDLNPPTVPTLVVNPSGSDNNWVISAVGDHGLSLDLMQGIDNRPTKWGAAAALTGGTTYTFRFNVMHSTVASYGSGGIGGADIQYTPEVDGSFDFIFDDRDDSYLVQLTGTEGPMTYLAAQSGLDGHIPVGWLPPGTTESQEMAYDDGTVANGYYYFAFDNLMATMFVPESYPVTIDSVMVHVLTEGDQYWPWPDGTHDPVGVSIYLDDGNGMPETDPVFYAEVTCELGSWIRVDVEEVLVASGNFWVALNNVDGGGEDGMGLDANTDYPANKWARESGVWGQQNTYNGDHMIRAKVFGGGRLAWMGYDSSPAGEIPVNVPLFLNPEGTSGIRNPFELKDAGNSRVSNNRTAYYPKTSRVHPPVESDTQVLAGFNLYRDTQAAPFDRNLKINSELIGENHYDDWGTDPYGPLVNGTTYHYQGSAVYDIGEGQFVEVGPSNEALATPVNHPPMDPVNLVGSSLIDTVSLAWSANADYDIASYKVYRRNYGESEFVHVGTVTHPDTTFSEILSSDGIYRYKVAAVDAGGMQSTGFSNYIDIPIGAIPPRTLTATTTLESEIKLDWRNPGLRPLDPMTGNIGILISDYAGAEQEVAEYLINSGEIESAVFIDAQNSTPTLQDLEVYDAIITWTNYQYQDAAGIGDVLADYVELGKGVIVLEFAYYNGWAMQGRFMSDYSPYSQASTGYLDVTLGEYDAGHPIMENVSAVGDYYVHDVGTFDYTEVVASWNNGWPFVAVNSDFPSVVGINGYVGLPARRWTGDMLQVILNSVLFVSGGQGIEPDNFKVYKGDSESGPFEFLAQVDGSVRTYTDTPVPNNQDFYYYVTAVYPGPDESDPSNVARGRAVVGGRLVVTPTSFNVNAQVGEQLTELLNISNNGGLDIEFTIETMTDNRLGAPRGGRMPDRSEREEFSSYSVEFDKTSEPPVENNPPMILDRGGPDAFGYVWIDSDEQGGPPSAWVDIVNRGSEIFMSDDDNQGPFYMDFDFPFYGNLYSSFRVCSNGFISFTSTNANYSNGPIPDPSSPLDLLAPFWDDLYPPGGGQIWVYSNTDSAVVSWISVPHYGSGGPYTFQVVLTSSGTVSFNYDYVGSPDAEATIGIQNSDGTVGLQIAFNQYYAHDGLSVLINAGWLSADPRSGSVPAGDDFDATIGFDASFLSAGTYTGSLIVTAYDINHMVDQITVPVTFVVSPIVGIDDGLIDLPKEFALRQNYPNPFNPTTEIKFDLPATSHVNLQIFNVLGQKVKTLVDGEMEAGYRSVTWNGTDNNGKSVSSGVYFYKLDAGEHVFTKKMMMLK